MSFPCSLSPLKVLIFQCVTSCVTTFRPSVILLCVCVTGASPDTRKPRHVPSPQRCPRHDSESPPPRRAARNASDADLSPQRKDRRSGLVIPLSAVLCNRIKAHFLTLISLFCEGLCPLGRISRARGVPLISHLTTTVTLRDLPRR